VPTLNLETENELLPETGVYITRISLDGNEFLDSITNVGVRPTFGETTLVIETFVLNDAVAPDAMSARVEFLRRIRNEVKFDSPDALRRQIALDAGRAQRFFALMREYRHAGNG
jgi:riboflavin kinase/FMN adenylyltransferase